MVVGGAGGECADDQRERRRRPRHDHDRRLRLRTVLESGSFALNVDPRFRRPDARARLPVHRRSRVQPDRRELSATTAHGGRAPGVPRDAGTDADIVLKRNQGPNDSFDVTASLGAGSDVFMFAGPGLAGRNTVDGGSGRDGLNFRLCTCPAGVIAGLDNRDGLTGFEVLVGLARAGHADRAGRGCGARAAPRRRRSRATAATTRSRPSTGSRSRCRAGRGTTTRSRRRSTRVLTDCERVDLFAGAPVIGAGPSGVVGSSSARFEFALVGANPPPGRFECALDGGAFTPCASPVELSGLADGEHVFAVRYHPDGADPGAAAERRWTVDTRAPAVVFDAAPAGEDNPAEALIAFSASEAATFECSLDAGPLFDCSSPHPLAGLAAGPHSFTVQATDRAGQHLGADHRDVGRRRALDPADGDLRSGHRRGRIRRDPDRGPRTRRVLQRRDRRRPAGAGVARRCDAQRDLFDPGAGHADHRLAADRRRVGAGRRAGRRRPRQPHVLHAVRPGHRRDRERGQRLHAHGPGGPGTGGRAALPAGGRVRVRLRGRWEHQGHAARDAAAGGVPAAPGRQRGRGPDGRGRADVLQRQGGDGRREAEGRRGPPVRQGQAQGRRVGVRLRLWRVRRVVRDVARARRPGLGRADDHGLDQPRSGQPGAAGFRKLGPAGLEPQPPRRLRDLPAARRRRLRVHCAARRSCRRTAGCRSGRGSPSGPSRSRRSRWTATSC